MVMQTDGTTHNLLDKKEMEAMLLEHSQTHFAKVEGSTFTQEPLSPLLQYNGLTKYGDIIFKGQPLTTHHQFDKPTSAILTHLQSKIPLEVLRTHMLNYKTLLQGTKKWPEQTTTSPSGCHLGIHKSLGKHVIKKKKAKETVEETPPTQDRTEQGRDILYMIFDIMSIALANAYPLEQWCKVWTLFIEKDLGNLDINRLWCTMLFEANWQLLLKWHFLYGFLPKTEEAGTLIQAQGGG